MTKNDHFDAIIIGIGQAGNPLASRLSQEGWQIAVVERKFPGGTCVNYGCTPTKTMIASAKVAYTAKDSRRFGVQADNVKVDLKQIKTRKDEIVENSRQRIEKKFEEDQNIHLIYGEAHFTGSKSIAIALNQGGSREIKADRIFINTGVSPRMPDIEGLDQAPVLNNETIMELEEVPEHLIVIGGSYIGLEFGQMFSRFGSRVTVIESGLQLVSREDSDVASALKDIFEQEGMAVYLQAKPEKATFDQGKLTLNGNMGKQMFQVKGSHLLIGAGRIPNTQSLNLSAAGIETDQKGFIKVNDKLETSQPDVYALGDVKGGPAFTHISYDDYRVVVKNMFENGDRSISDRMTPYTMFTDPQLGRVGLNEKMARSKQIDYKLAQMPMEMSARAYETGQTKGMMKVLINPENDRLLGVTILGEEGGEIMAVLQTAMMGDLPYTALRDGVFAHPTYAESLNNLFMKVE